MKRVLIIYVTLLTASAHAQWAQTALGGAQYGYNLFSDTSGVWAATLNGVYQTSDSGNPWFSWGLTNRLVFDVVRSGPYLLAATEGTGPGVYRTSDNGANWIPANGIADRSVRAFTKNSSYIFACTWGGGVFRSSDDGANWQLLGLTNHGFRSMFTVGEVIFAGGDSIFFSGNNGATWTGRQLPYPAGDTRCFAYQNGKLYAGDAGLYVSTDLGMTWSLVYGVSFDGTGTAVNTTMFHDLIFNNQTLIASRSPGAIGVSHDNGVSWSAWNEGVMDDWTFSALAIRSPYIWALRGFFGNAYLRPLSDIVTGVEEASISSPAGFLLSQNYPNPFNPNTVISFQLPVASEVRLVVFDLLGREVATLLSGQKPAGVHKVPFDAGNLASGVYLYRLQAGGFVAARTLNLLR